MADLFDDPKPNSPEDLGQTSTFVPRSEQTQPWQRSHPDHPSNRPHNKLEPGEDPPASWNVANVEMGIAEMRTFLTWCTDKNIDTTGHSVGTLYCALNAHSKNGFKWLCTQLGRTGMAKLPHVAALDKAIKARDETLLYSGPDD